MERVEARGRCVAPAGAHRGAGVLSPWGYLLFTVWAVLAATLLEGWELVALVAVELAFGLVWSRRALLPFRRPRFWLLALICVASGLVLIGERDAVLGPLRFSHQGLLVGLEMGGRVLTLTLGFGLGVGALSLSDVMAVFGCLGLRGLGFAVGLAANLTHTLQDMALVAWQTIWLRGGGRRPLCALRLFLITTVANTLRYGDDVVSAAEARAFDPNDGRTTPVPLRRADLAVALLIVVCSVLMIALV